MKKQKNLHRFPVEAEDKTPLSSLEEERLASGPESADFSFSFEDQIATGLDRRSLRREED